MSPTGLVQAALLAAMAGVLSWAFRALTPGGAIIQFFLGTALLAIGGWKWTVPILAFFVLSSLFSRIGTKRKAVSATAFEKTSRRDGHQVAANGGVTGVLVLLWGILGWEPLYAAGMGAIAAATADTWGTEIGTLWGRKPRLITTGEPVQPGRSGGITLAGSLAGIAGSATIAVSTLPWGGSPESLFAIVLGGISGSLADSFLGATVQAQFVCGKCGLVSEIERHCGTEPSGRRGIPLIRNDAVNLCATIAGASVALVVGSRALDLLKILP